MLQQVLYGRNHGLKPNCLLLHGGGSGPESWVVSYGFVCEIASSKSSEVILVRSSRRPINSPT